MAKISLYFDLRRPDKNGCGQMKIRVSAKNKVCFVNICNGVSPDKWDFDKEMFVKKCREKSITEKSYLIAQTALDVIEISGEIRKMSAQQIKDYIEGELGIIVRTEKKALNSFESVYCKFLNEKHGRTRELYEITLKRIEEYAKSKDIDLSFSIDKIDRAWLVDFDRFLSERSPSPNARAIHLRNIRAIFNYAIDEEITVNYPFRRFKIETIETIKRSLTAEEIRLLMTLGVDDSERKYIDLFLLIFMLIGINIGDFCELREINSSGYVEYRRKKTNKLYRIKVEPEALEIINKYKGKKYLLNIMDTYNNYRHFMKRMNMCLQLVGETKVGNKGVKIRKPLFPNITTYWARHSWASIAHKIGISKDVISLALGHSFGNRVTDVYIDYDMDKVDEANRRVIDYVLYDKK